MTKFLGFAVLFAALALPAFGQYRSNQLSPQDQQQFDKYYQKWVDDTRRNDRDDIRKDEGHMQDIMRHYDIPADVPYDRVASSGAYGGGYGDRDRDRGYYGNGNANWQGRLSPSDQQSFDNAYSKWMKDQRSDRDDIPKDERKMRDIMSRYNIPQDVPFDAVASQGQGRRY